MARLIVGVLVSCCARPQPFLYGQIGPSSYLPPHISANRVTRPIKMSQAVYTCSPPPFFLTFSTSAITILPVFQLYIQRAKLLVCLPAAILNAPHPTHATASPSPQCNQSLRKRGKLLNVPATILIITIYYLSSPLQSAAHSPATVEK